MVLNASAVVPSSRTMRQACRLQRCVHISSSIASKVHCPQVTELHKTSSRPTGSEHQSRSMAAPAVAHHALTRTPLQTPIVQPSHTCISIPLGSIDLYGNYSVQGPAVIRKINNALVALVQPGGFVSVLSSPTEGPTQMSSASLSHDEDEAALCRLVGHHLELDGSFIIQDKQGGIVHDGKTILSVSHMSEDNCITLLPGGSVSHPVNVHPHH